MDRGAAPRRDATLGGAFGRLWAAGAVSSLGDGVLTVALPLVAATLTTDERLIAGVAVAETLPWLLFAVVAGSIADRRSYRQVLVGADLARAAILVLLAVRLVTGGLSVYVLLVATFGLGVLKPLFDAAAYRAVPSVVDDGLLERANGYLEATISGSDAIAGRALGGVLYAWSSSVPIIGDAISFALSAALLRTLPADQPLIDRRADRSSLRADMAAGFRWFRANPLIRALTGLVAVMALAQSMVFAVIVVIAQRRLGLSARGFGLFLGAVSVGGIVGSLVAPRLVAHVGQRRYIVGALSVVAVCYAPTWATTSAVAAAMALSVQAGAIGATNVVIVTIRQRVIPRAMIGTVSNVIRTFTWGALPIGSFLGGVLAHRFEVRTPLLVAAVLSGVVAVVAGPLLGRRLALASAADH